MKFQVIQGEQPRTVILDDERNTLDLDGNIYDYQLHALDNGIFVLRLGSKTYTIANAIVEDGKVSFSVDGHFFSFPVKDEQQILLAEMGFKDMAASGEGKLTAPMPGKVLEILVSEGDDVQQGDPLIILEAMKMENELKAPVAGKIANIAVQSDTSVEKNTLLIEIEAIG